MKFYFFSIVSVFLFFGCQDFTVDDSFKSNDSLLYYPTNEIIFFQNNILLNPKYNMFIHYFDREFFGLIWFDIQPLTPPPPDFISNIEADFITINSNGNIINTFDLKSHIKKRSKTFFVNKNGSIYCSSYAYTDDYLNNIDSCRSSSQIVKYNIDGSVDKSFKFKKRNIISTILCEYDKNQILMAYSDSGRIQSNKICIIDTLGNTLPDLKISQQKLFSSDEEYISNIVLLKNKKMLISGNFNNFLGEKCSSNMILLNADGTLDNKFNKDGAGFNGIVKKMIVLEDERILVCGDFSLYNNKKCPNCLLILKSNGQLDPTFNYNGKGFTLSYKDESKYSNGYVNDIDIFENGDILVGGAFSHYNYKKTARSIALITRSGELSKKYFYYNSGFDSDVKKVKIKNNDTIYLSAEVGIYNGRSYGQSILRFTKSYTFPNIIYHIF